MNIVADASEREGMDFWRPAPNHLYYNRFEVVFQSYSTRQTIAINEVEHTVNYLGIPNWKRYINENVRLQKLQSFARENPPPELLDEFDFLISKFDIDRAKAVKANI